VFDTEEPHIVLRLVYYQAHPQQEILARPHFDAGSFTLAIAESAPGLRIGSKQENLELVPYDKNGMIFMLGANCGRMVPHEKLLPSWHDVIRLDNLTTRWELVAFIDGHSVESPSLHDTHLKDQKERTTD
jgi:isopenicillin N synthase-like dioxygenase